jgi:hypothetical protein
LLTNVTRDPAGTVTSFGETTPFAPIVMVAPTVPGFSLGAVGVPPPLLPQAAKATASVTAMPVFDQVRRVIRKISSRY